MLIYITIFLFLFLGVFLKPRKQYIYLLISFLVLFFLSAFRDVNIGTDTSSYALLFKRVESGHTLHRQEIGWYYFNKLIIYLGGNFQWVLISSTLLTLCPVFLVVRKYSLNPMLSIFLFFAFYIYLQSFNITRQVVSVSLIFGSLPFLIERKHKYYLIGVFASGLIHITAFLCLPLIYIKKISYHRIWWVLIVLTSLIFGALLSNILLPKIAGILGYSHYLSRFDSGDAEAGLFLLLTNIFALFLIVTSSKKSIYLQLFFVYIIFYNVVASVPFAYRLVYYFSIVQLLFLPYYIYHNKLKHRYAALFIILVYATLFFIRTFGAGGVVPYKGTLF